LPTFASSAYGHSQPLPTNDPTLPFAKTSACCGFASSVVLLARDSDFAIEATWFSAASAFGEFSVPFHLPPERIAIFPP
jgi:hypothetical protein